MNQEEQINQYISSKAFEKVFNLIVDEYQQRLYWHIRRMVNNHDDANDVLQNTFIKIWKALPKFKGDSKFSTWLYRICYHTTLDAIKKNKKNNYTFEINEVTYNQIQSVETILQGIERKERSVIMDKCLMKLPDEERSILWMFYYDELSLKEIIEVTGLSEANIKVKLHRARKKLLSIVEENVEPEIINHYGRK